MFEKYFSKRIQNTPSSFIREILKVTQNPEIIFITSMGDIDEIKLNMEQSINSNEAWQSIQAVKNNQLYYLPQDMFLLSPELNYPKAVKIMAQLVYPDIFK